ncbi:Elongin-A [Geodia barretti]|uniref:Elongin-A n=1 Tax=Geodia barretti TaxID=519541 RepID=A0AA35WSL9_GEOBA|nr:Elongin-A [Geodia barretti]
MAVRTTQDLVKMVNKLKSKLREATSHGLQEGAVQKILQKLVGVPMTLELLQLTHIGKEVNGLRKAEGDVGRAAKQLVRSWKQLLTEAGGESEEGEREEEGRGGWDGRERHRAPVPTIQPSCSLLAAPPPPRRSPSPLPWRVEDTATPGVLPAEHSPQRKRKTAVEEPPADAVAHTKRSRTQVYSGKKASGPQVAVSLFDLSMKVLMDNIDAIEEVGGVPYLILEPLLQKCSATQLLRLEEFNTHFLEDSDVLWKKHCEKDFKGARPHGNQESWRQLYLSKLSDREERLKNITANIRKREEARKEPVRQVKLAVATRAPGRRRQVSSIPLPSRPSLLNSSRPSHMRAPPTS